MVAYEVARNGFLDDHVRKIREVYRLRRDIMLGAMERHFPPEISWTHPQGGLFLWVTLPEALDATDLLPAAIAERVAYVPGVAFDPLGAVKNTLRLNFSNASPPMIEEGIRRLGLVFHQAVETSRSPAIPAPVAGVL
jgi:2-aminoadipate transaminase